MANLRKVRDGAGRKGCDGMMPLSKERLIEVREEMKKRGLTWNKSGIKAVLTPEEFAAAGARKKREGYNAWVSALIIERRRWEPAQDIAAQGGKEE